MKELRELVRQFVANEIDYPTFRNAMVVRFQSKRSDGVLQDAVNAIGDACADYSQAVLSESALKDALKTATMDAAVSSKKALARFRTIDFSRSLVPFTTPQSDAAAIPDFAANPGLDVKWLDLGELLFAAPADKESSVVFASVEPLHQ